MFALPKLDYEYDSLVPHFSKEILEVHHGKHHQIYVDKLNTVMESLPAFQNKTIEELIGNLNEVPEEFRTAVKNFGGGHYNHSLFWNFLSPDGGGEPSGELIKAIVEKYGSFQQFKDEFTTRALSIFGSGWLWLMPNLSIVVSANQDSPINGGLPAPILGVDVWEHAYYIDHKYNRAEYINAWWQLVDWAGVEKRYKFYL
ncbi:superoxide dismutase [Candidatus Saccharibacteria bacterium HGW-Saccharibacteria-1]|jgi:Fe-Mn family superoxide dismutase|nr:MAG: superoxide dismutase [Candidatus Saccharibacteria bacterium HGW-Saccharibacteria-1]